MKEKTAWHSRDSVNALGQIYLHLRCALRRPANWRWHLAGLRRALIA